MTDFPPESLQSKTTFYLKHIEYKKEKIRSLNISGPKPTISGWLDSSLFKVGSGPGFYAGNGSETLIGRPIKGRMCELEYTIVLPECQFSTVFA